MEMTESVHNRRGSMLGGRRDVNDKQIAGVRMGVTVTESNAKINSLGAAPVMALHK